MPWCSGPMPEPAGVLVRKIRERGMKFPDPGLRACRTSRFPQGRGPSRRGGHRHLSLRSATGKIRSTWISESGMSAFREDPDAYAVHSYDGTTMPVEAIRKAGLNRYRIRDKMASMRHWDGISGEIILDEALSNRRPVTVATVKNGRFVFGIPHLDNVF